MAKNTPRICPVCQQEHPVSVSCRGFIVGEPRPANIQWAESQDPHDFAPHDPVFMNIEGRLYRVLDKPIAIPSGPVVRQTEHIAQQATAVGQARIEQFRIEALRAASRGVAGLPAHARQEDLRLVHRTVIEIAEPIACWLETGKRD